ncbi:MAG: methyltransferase [Acidobacteriota bacterium]
MNDNEIFNRMMATWQGRPLTGSADIAQLIQISWVSNLVYVAAELGIADLLKNGPKSIDALALATGSHTPSLYRVMRALAGFGIFAEVDQRCFEITPIAQCLTSDAPDSLRALARFCGGISYQLWGNLLHSVKTGETAFQHLFGMGFFDFLMNPQNAELGRSFGETLIAVWKLYFSSVATAYDFSKAHKVVDVGGNLGLMIESILRAYPDLQGVLFDLPPVVEQAQQRLTAVGLADRCQVVGGNFFEAVPSGGDIYLISQVIHDWDDARSIAILQNCRRAISTQGKLLVIEMALEENNQPMFSKLTDIMMLVFTGGAERTEAQYRSLFAAAGFELARVIRTNTQVNIMEGLPLA